MRVGALMLVMALSTSAAAQTTLQPKSTIATAPAPAEVPLHQLVYRSTNIFRFNPLGLMTDNQISFRRRLYANDSAFLRDNFVGVGLTPQLSAGFARVGVLAEVQPLSVLRLWANFDAVGYFGTFGLLQSFDSPRADFSDTTISALGELPDGDPRKNSATTGSQLTLGVDLQAKVGPIAGRNLFRFVRGSYDIRPGDTVYYDQFYDVLAPNDGFYLNNDTDLFWVTDFGLIAGVRLNVTNAFYSDDDYLDGEPRRHENGPTVRAGPLVTYTFFDDPTAVWNKPTIIVSTQWHLLHRFRTGAGVHPAIPYVVVAFQFSGDLLARQRAR